MKNHELHEFSRIYLFVLIREIRGQNTKHFQRKSMIIGIIGKSGSGKSSAAKYIAEKYNFALVDLDQIGKEAVSLYPQILVEVAEAFGSEYVDGSQLNRPALGKLVFGNEKELAKLNQIFFKYIIAEIHKRTAQNDNSLLEGAVLTELGVENLWDKLIFVQTEEQLMLQRLQERENTPVEVLQKRLASQKKYDRLVESADFVISNNQSTAELEKQIDNVMNKL